MPTKKKFTEISEVEILATQQKKSSAARQAEVRKTGEHIRAHKHAHSGKIKKALIHS